MNVPAEGCRSRRHLPGDRVQSKWRLGLATPGWVLVILVGAWALLFTVLVYQRHERFASLGNDLGIYDQAAWLLSRHDGQFLTVRGLPVLGHHANFALYLMVPFYWAGAGPHFLNVFQVAALALGAIPVFLLARHRLTAHWRAVGFASAYLLHPSLQFMAWETFHPETMAITPLLFAYWFAVRQRWGWFSVCVVLGMAWKEDVSLVVVVLGLIIWARGHRRVGLTTSCLAMVWFIFAVFVVIPHFNDGNQAFYVDQYRYLGDSSLEMAVTAIRHPTRLVERLLAAGAGSYLWKVLAPLAVLALMAPGVAAMALPQVLANLLTVDRSAHSVMYHWVALPLTAAVLASVEGGSRLAKRFGSPGLVGAAVACAALAGTVAWGPSPLGVEFRRGWWGEPNAARQAAKAEALRHVPDRAAVSASNHLVPHLTHRSRIYQFPNPFVPREWGVEGERFPGPTAVSWVAVDRAELGSDDRELLDQLLSNGDFTVRYNRLTVVVAERVGAIRRG